VVENVGETANVSARRGEERKKGRSQLQASHIETAEVQAWSKINEEAWREAVDS